MSLRNTQKPLKELLNSRDKPALIVAVPAGMQPFSVITATYDVGLAQPFVSNKAGNIGALSPILDTSQQPTEIEPSSVELLTREFLTRVGECANCSSDLYADSELAEEMQGHVHSGACVICGSPVSYANTGELAHIATGVKRTGLSGIEIANYFDFTELNTVDPNTVEENDMSTKQARAALRARVASVIQSMNEMASEDETVEMLPEDDDDFASESDDEELDTMDMDESDPSDEDDSEDEDEEVTEEEAADTNASAEAPAVDENTNDEEASDMNVQTDPKPESVEATEENTPKEEATEETVTAETPLTDSEEANEANPEESADALVSEEATEQESETEETTIEEVATVEDTATIEYVATTPDQISPDAELVPVSETAYYVVQDEAPVAILRKENASAGAQSMWSKSAEFRKAFAASLSGNRETALASFGGKILSHSTNVGKVIADRIAQSEQASQAEIAAERTNVANKHRQCLEIAAMGVIKGMFGNARANPIASELAGVLEVNGLRDPKMIITASMIQSAPKFLTTIFEVAEELMAKSDDALTAQAEMVGNSEFLAPVVTNEAPTEKPEATSEPAPVLVPETATAKPKFDINRLMQGVGRSAHSSRG